MLVIVAQSPAGHHLSQMTDYLFDFVSSKVMALLLLYLNHEYNSVDKKEELKDRGRNVG